MYLHEGPDNYCRREHLICEQRNILLDEKRAKMGKYIGVGGGKRSSQRRSNELDGKERFRVI